MSVVSDTHAIAGEPARAGADMMHGDLNAIFHRASGDFDIPGIEKWTSSSRSLAGDSRPT